MRVLHDWEHGSVASSDVPPHRSGRVDNAVQWLVPLGRRYGYAAMLSLAAGYTLAIGLLARQGAMPVPAPFLRIPDESYYLWSTWFIGLVLLAGWLLAAAAMHLSAHALGGTGTFEDLAPTLGMAIAVASTTTLLPDLLMGILGNYGGEWTAAWYGRTLITGYLTVYVALFLMLFPAVVRAVYGLRSWRAIASGSSAFFLYQAFLFIFVR